MRAVTLGLLLACAAGWGGCGEEASERGSATGSASVPLQGPDEGRSPAAPPEALAAEATLTPVGRALAAWVRARPLHVALSLTHKIQPGGTWTGSIERWRRMTAANIAAPLEIDAWVGVEERAAFSSDEGASLSYFAGLGKPWLALRPSPDTGVVVLPRIPIDGSEPVRLPVEVQAPGWHASAPPSAARLGAALDVILNPVRLKDWLAGVPAWSTAIDGPGTAYHAMARGTSTGLGREVDVKIVLGERDAILRLEVEVRLDRDPQVVLAMPGVPDVPSELRPGTGVWDTPFPLPTLLLPDDVYGRTKAKGDPTLGDVTHERTTFVLRPDPNPPTPAFAKFLATQRTRR